MGKILVLLPDERQIGTVTRYVRAIHLRTREDGTRGGGTAAPTGYQDRTIG